MLVKPAHAHAWPWSVVQGVEHPGHMCLLPQTCTPGCLSVPCCLAGEDKLQNSTAPCAGPTTQQDACHGHEASMRLMRQHAPGIKVHQTCLPTAKEQPLAILLRECHAQKSAQQPCPQPEKCCTFSGSFKHTAQKPTAQSCPVSRLSAWCWYARTTLLPSSTSGGSATIRVGVTKTREISMPYGGMCLRMQALEPDQACRHSTG